MGNVSEKEMNDYIRDNFENAYYTCNTESEFKGYFEKYATTNKIDLEKEKNRETFNKVIKIHLKTFTNRKNYERKMQEDNLNLKNQLENLKIQNSNQEELLKRYENNIKENKEMQDKMMEKIDEKNKEIEKNHKNQEELLKKHEEDLKKREEDNKHMQEEMMKKIDEKNEEIKKNQKNQEELLKKHEEDLKKREEDNKHMQEEMMKKIDEKNEEIKKNQKNQEDLLKKHEEDLKKRDEDFANKIKKINEENQKNFENKIEEITKKNSQNIENIQNEYLKKIEEMNKNAEIEKKKLEEKYKQEKDENKKKVNQEFDEKVNTQISYQLEEILKKFKKEESTFCLDNIKGFKTDKLSEVIKILFKNEDISKNIKENIKLQLNLLLDEPNRKVNHLNILVLGISGVGKSSLIKILLGYEELKEGSKDIPEDGFFKPTTEGKPKYYESKMVPFLKLADTQGIEISSKTSKKPYGISEVEEDTSEFIIQQNESGNPDNYVHCIWYCFQPNSGRFQDDEEILLEKLSKQYSIESLPIIMVGTQANSKEKIKLFEEGFAKKQFKFNFDFVPVLAKKMDNIEPFGLDILQKISIEKSMKAVKSQCYQGILEDVKQIFLNNLDKKSEDILKNIELYKEQYLKEISKGKEINQLKSDIIHIFVYILNNFNSYLLNKKTIEENNQLKKESLESLGKFFDSYFTQCLLGYQDCLNDFIEKFTNEVVVNMIEFQNSFNKSHDGLVYIKSKIEWERILKNSIFGHLKKYAENYCNKNALIFLMDLLVLYFKNAYIRTFQQILDAKTEKTKDIDELIKGKISNQFIEISKKVEEYQKKIKEEEKRRKEEEEKKRKKEEEKRKKEEEKRKKEEERLKREKEKKIEPINGLDFNIDDTL